MLNFSRHLSYFGARYPDCLNIKRINPQKITKVIKFKPDNITTKVSHSSIITKTSRYRGEQNELNWHRQIQSK